MASGSRQGQKQERSVCKTGEVEPADGVSQRPIAEPLRCLPGRLTEPRWLAGEKMLPSPSGKRPQELSWLAIPNTQVQLVCLPGPQMAGGLPRLKGQAARTSGRLMRTQQAQQGKPLPYLLRTSSLSVIYRKEQLLSLGSVACCILIFDMPTCFSASPFVPSSPQYVISVPLTPSCSIPFLLPPLFA